MSAGTPGPQGGVDALPILDGRGCLTFEAICFADLLGPDQRAAVERHVRACTFCAQQQASMARAAQEIRREKPRVPVPADARVAGRQAMLRSLLLQRRPQAVSERLQIIRAGRPSSMRAWLAVGLSAAVVIAVALLVLLL